MYIKVNLEMKKYHQKKEKLNTDNIILAIKECGNYEANLYIDGECVFSPLQGDLEDDNKTLEPYGIQYIFGEEKNTLVTIKTLVLKSNGEDNFGRKLYKGIRYCQDGYVYNKSESRYIEYDGEIYSITYCGQLDCKVDETIKIMIVD